MGFLILETEQLELMQFGRQYADQVFDILLQDKVFKYYGMDSLATLEGAA